MPTSKTHVNFLLPESKKSVPCILIVEDDDDLRELISEEIFHYGFNIESAPNGEIALKLILADLNENSQKRRIDAVLCDIKMPTMNGFQLVNELNRLKFERPLVVMTADPSPENREWAKANGVFNFLEKPFDFEVFKNTILSAGQIGFQLNNQHSNAVK